MKEIVSLNGTWSLQSIQEGQGEVEGFTDGSDCTEGENAGWMPANVPDDIPSVLVQAGVLPDLMAATHGNKIQWVMEREWWYRKRAPIPSAWLQSGCRVKLIFERVNHQSHFWVDGQDLGDHWGGLTPAVFDITELVAHKTPPASFLIAVRITPLGPYPALPANHRPCLGYDLLHYPSLRPIGLCGPVRLAADTKVSLDKLILIPYIEHDLVWIKVRVRVTNAGARLPTIGLRILLQGETFHDPPLEQTEIQKVAVGSHWLETTLDIPNARLWWPHHLGSAPLYRATVSLLRGAEILDQHTTTFGIRTVERRLTPHQKRGDEPWQFAINGVNLYLKGAYWMGPGLYSRERTPERYSSLLNRVRSAHINLLRVPANTLPEEHPFYDLCDRLGILVWQDYPYAVDVDLTQAAQDECRSLLEDLAHHPSLIALGVGESYNRRAHFSLMKALEKMTRDTAPDRAYIWDDRPHDQRANLTCLTNPATFSLVADNPPPFVSQFMFPAAPDLSSLTRFFPATPSWPPDAKLWKQYGANLDYWYDAIQTIVGINKENLTGLTELVQASQQMQAWGLRFVIEMLRRQKPANCGFLLWCFNESWPTLGPSLVDWYGTPKLAYEVVRNAYAPLLVSLEHRHFGYPQGGKLDATIWVLNDQYEHYQACTIRCRIHAVEQTLYERSYVRNIPSQTTLEVSWFEWQIPADLDGPFLVSLTLQRPSGQLLSSNTYSLYTY